MEGKGPEGFLVEGRNFSFTLYRKFIEKRKFHKSERKIILENKF